jgi:hypothetical protein
MASGNALILTKRMADAYFTGTFKFLLVSSVPARPISTRTISATTLPTK